MINFSHGKLKLLLPTALITILLTACGGGSGGSSDGGGGFAGSSTTTNTKPQVSSESSESSSILNNAASSTEIVSISSSLMTSSDTSISKSTQAKSSSSSSKSTSSAKSVSNGIDKIAPTSPEDFNVVSAFSDVIFLSWSKATDNVAVTSYKLYRDGIQIADLAEPENYYADYNVAAGRSYVYGLSVGDAAGNWSAPITLSTVPPLTGQGSSKTSSSSKSASSTNSSKSSSSSAPVAMGVFFQWQPPAYRENGSDMFEYEIARYELRYKLTGATDFITVLITSPLLTKSLPDVPSDTEFEIATVDNNGMYSRFVPIHPL